MEEIAGENSLKPSVSMLDFREVAQINAFETVLTKLNEKSEIGYNTEMRKASSAEVSKEDSAEEKKDDTYDDVAANVEVQRNDFVAAPFCGNGKRSPLRRSVSSNSFCISGAELTSASTNKSSLKKNPTYTRGLHIDSEISDRTECSEDRGSKRNVSFSSLGVRRYRITLGDNPAVSFGLPVTLSWEYEKERRMELEYYEAHRGQRRNVRQMCMHYKYRRRIFEDDLGYTADELKDAMNEIKKIQKSRRKAVTNFHMRRFEEVMESAARKIKRALGDTSDI